MINCSLPFKNDKPPINTRIRVEAPDGSISNDITMLGDNTRKRVIVRSDGLQITVYDDIQSKFTVLSSHRRQAETRSAMLNPAADCIVSFRGESGPGKIRKIGDEWLLGYRAIKVVIDTPSIRRTSWRLPDVGCFEAQIFSEYLDPKDPSKVQGTSLITTDQFTVGQPASTYFEAPAGYTERKPSDISVELMAQLLQRHGRSPEEARKTALQKIAADAGQKQLDEICVQHRAFR